MQACTRQATGRKRHTRDNQDRKRSRSSSSDAPAAAAGAGDAIAAAAARLPTTAPTATPAAAPPELPQQQQRSAVSDDEIEATILQLLRARSAGATCCPSEAPRRLRPSDWRPLMERTRQVAMRMARAGIIEITQKGKVCRPRQHAARMRRASARWRLLAAVSACQRPRPPAPPLSGTIPSKAASVRAEDVGISHTECANAPAADRRRRRRRRLTSPPARAPGHQPPDSDEGTHTPAPSGGPRRLAACRRPPLSVERAVGAA
jgi:hypothetical protein